MTTQRDPDTILAAWLDEGPTDLPDATRRAIFSALPTTSQARRGLFAPRSFFQMNTYPRLAAVALVAVVAVGGALYLIGQRPGVGGNSPIPTLAPGSPSPSIDTTTWAPFTFSVYGYAAAHPQGWGLAPATERWAGQTSYDLWHSDTNAPWADKTFAAVEGITMTGLATVVPAGTSEEASIDAYLKWPAGATPTGPSAAPPCVELAKDMTPIVIDGKPARLAAKCEAVAAFVFVGNRMFVFEEEAQNQLPLMNAYLSTITLPAPAPSPT